MQIPRFLQPIPHGSSPPKIQPVPPERIGILLVDDEPALRHLLGAVLSDEGYYVVEAGNAEEAIEASRAAERIDLVVTDVRMPKMDGIKMVAKLRESNPDLRAIFVTGYAVDDLSRLGPNTCLLNKPFLRRSLIDLVHRFAAGVP